MYAPNNRPCVRYVKRKLFFYYNCGSDTCICSLVAVAVNIYMCCINFNFLYMDILSACLHIIVSRLHIF